jgi:hypothetical protein
MLGYIHITKTGGTEIKAQLDTKQVVYGYYHNEDALHYKKKKMPSFAVIRDPVERYKSLFYYNMYGGNKHKKRDTTYNNINVFVAAHYANPLLINKYENGVQFKKQVHWLKEADLEKTWLIVYDKAELLSRVISFYDNNKIQYTNKNLPRINVTNYTNPVPLSEDSITKIREMYKEDVELYERVVKTGKHTIKMSEL